MKNTWTRKLLVVLLAASVIFTNVPVTTYAVEDAEPVTEETSSETAEAEDTLAQETAEDTLAAAPDKPVLRAAGVPSVGSKENGNYMTPSEGSAPEGLNVAPGGLLSYDIHYKNSAGAAAGSISVNLPDNLVFNEASDGPGEVTCNGSTVIWTIPETASADSFVTLQVNVAENATEKVVVGPAYITFNNGETYETESSIKNVIPNDPTKAVAHPAYSGNQQNGDEEAVYIGGGNHKAGNYGNEDISFKLEWTNQTEVDDLTLHIKDVLDSRLEYVGLMIGIHQETIQIFGMQGCMEPKKLQVMAQFLEGILILRQIKQ